MRRYQLTTISILALAIATPILAQTDPLPALLVQFKSNDAEQRETAFSSLLDLGAQAVTKPSGAIVADEVSALLKKYPNDAQLLHTSLITLLALENNENAQVANGPSTPSEDETETDTGEYFANLVNAVCSLNDIDSIPVLLPLLDSGKMVSDALVGLGQISLDPILGTLYSPDPPVRDGATFALLDMLTTTNFTFRDATSRSKIRAGLLRSVSLAGDSFMIAQANKGLDQLPNVIAGDLNADGLVNCADLAIIKTSFGKSVGQTGFDIRADVNGDGVVNILDLSAEAKLLPAGTKCQ